ncbi:hypothetical protein BBJ28_00024132 [Nothophytophthora sp. Chile5]|nr:hypothetical protein BBJ28_00024132 [Nothophytophthora sp. Chile5]
MEEESAHHSTVDTMERRTRTQSDLVLEEREHADRLLQEANARADRFLQEANARADRLLQEANARAARAEERADRAEQQRVNAVADGNSLADKRVAEAKENADKRVAEAKADADKRVAEAKENADKRVAEADKRVAEADKRVAEMKETTEKLVAQAEKIAAEADKRTAEAEKRSERAHDRLCDFSRYALNLAQETFTRSSPRLVNANAGLLDTNKLTYGCQGRVLRHHDDSATFDFVVGTRKEVAAEIDVPIQEYTSRDVASIKPVTRFRSVADTDKLTKRCLKNARGSWEKTKTEFQVPPKRRKCK